MGKVRVALAALAFVVSSPSHAQSTGNWRPFVVEASARFGVPEAWIWRVMAIESRGRTTLGGRSIRSPKGAMGLMQLMPDTWRAMRAAYGLGPDPDDPHDNIVAGTAYLRMMYDRFGYPGLFGAYNAGPGRYLASLSGTPLPRETRDYLAQTAGVPTRAATGPRTAEAGLFAVTPRVATPDAPSFDRPPAPSPLLVPLGPN